MITLDAATVRMSRTGRTVVVELLGPHDPRRPEMRLMPPHRVYVPLDQAKCAQKPKHLVNIAMHKSPRWLETCRFDYWFALVVVQCRPMRRKCTPLLQAINKTAHGRWGNQYWRHGEGRAFLRRELSLMGIKCPPDEALTISRYEAIKNL